MEARMCFEFQHGLADYGNFDSAIETHPKKHMMKNLA
jgi:hypothetical protein